MREIRKSGSEGVAGQNNVPFLPLSLAFASHTPSSHFRISEILRKATSVRTSCYHSLQTMKAHSYHCLFEIRLCSAKEGGMAVSAVWRLAYLLSPFPLEPRSRPKNTGGTQCAPLLKSKSKLFLVS